MEYAWYVIAAIGAGVGTGLAGLSAATVMVPILIVLCPSFSGENGAYQATAIALASDILGSAVTTSVYIRHKNIDLKRGWIMLVCIVTMCIAGSYAAYLVGNVVLGSFSLFLTFFIGIRFLVKPDTQRADTAEHGAQLGLREVLISLFFGLTIGFGTGFVGTGGGMMMLIVFTVFLKMDLKTAVGTSTFIMTATALIASISHIIIEPSIVLERWNVMLLCIIIATASSLISAQFANKVSNRTVGLATGVVLTVLGASMLLLNYYDVLAANALFTDTLQGILGLCGYIAAAVVILLLVKLFLKPPAYLFRKLLHLVAFTCLLEIILTGDNWIAAALTFAVFTVVVYPILCVLEHCKWYSDLLTQKSTGEIKKSLLLLCLVFEAVVVLCWGILGRPYLAVGAILMWGCGDGAAGLIGKRFGRHTLHLPLADEGKTWEGSAAMCLTAFAAGAIWFFLSGVLSWQQCLLYPLIAAPFAAYTELISRGGNDTVTVPLVTAAVLMICSICL